jgi:lipoprotein-releasing system ATP-binding protein
MKGDSLREPVLRLERIERRYGDLVVLQPSDLALRRGETIALLGPSGSGKSSLLHMAGLLEAPSGGEVVIEGRACSKLSDRARTLIRRDALGFVYQFHHLLPEFSALGNVMLPQLIAGRKKAEAEGNAKRLLSALGLGNRLHHQPGQLSGGEQQRAAIARALANRPKVLLADEPTGNLDSKNAQMVMDLLAALHKRGSTIVMVTHDARSAEQAGRQISLFDGKVVDDRSVGPHSKRTFPMITLAP